LRKLSKRGFKIWTEDWGRAGDAGYIALNATRAAGVALYRLMQRKADVTPRHIVSIGVEENEQNTGVGSILLPRLMQRATQDHIPFLSLTVLKSNELGQVLYQKVGFEFTGYEAETELGTILYMDASTSQAK
jgi:ribosomal protein S18 acetylase RimI-like enzyme